MPSPAKAPPSGPDWLHEVKHEGFRILALRDAADVRLYTRNGHAPLFPCDASHRQSRAGNV
jgi:ATP-dependent DNA ligase